MTITREQVADLRPGDVVEITDGYLCTARGPLRSVGTKGLALGSFCVVRYSDGGTDKPNWSLTVISRAPRPLYVNHDREKPCIGDVVRDADDKGSRWWMYAHPGDADPWVTYGSGGWWWGEDGLPARLRLLVDGETGQVVP